MWNTISGKDHFSNLALKTQSFPWICVVPSRTYIEHEHRVGVNQLHHPHKKISTAQVFLAPLPIFMHRIFYFGERLEKETNSQKDYLEPFLSWRLFQIGPFPLKSAQFSALKTANEKLGTDRKHTVEPEYKESKEKATKILKCRFSIHPLSLNLSQPEKGRKYSVQRT